jgi:hypothetical protein
MSLKSGSQAARSGRSANGWGQTGAATGKNYADKKAEALGAKNTVVLSFDELERIKSMCSQTNESEDYLAMRQMERTKLQQVSN